MLDPKEDNKNIPNHLSVQHIGVPCRIFHETKYLWCTFICILDTRESRTYVGIKLLYVSVNTKCLLPASWEIELVFYFEIQQESPTKREMKRENKKYIYGINNRDIVKYREKRNSFYRGGYRE